MANQEIPCKIHMLAIPFPLQGHINPMLQFSKLMASRGIKVTLVISSTLINLIQHNTTSSTISIESVPDVFDELEGCEDRIEGFIKAHKSSISRSLPKVVEKMESEGHIVKVIAYDLLMPWVLELAHQLGAKGASLSTQSCALSFIFYHFEQEGAMQLPLEEGGVVTLPGLPTMGRYDLPSLISDKCSYPALVRLLASQNENFGKADWVLFNTFDILEDEVVKWMKNLWPFKTIGPTIPSRYLDKKSKDGDEEDDEEYGLSLFKPADDKGWIKWLDSKEPGSVVYVSFGSLANIEEEQMVEILLGLANANFDFLWVVRASEETKLPSDLRHDTKDIGVIVNWCSQLEVLAHKSIGCFMTHCGWNSVVEALSLGIPMIAMPIWADQPTNAKFIEDVWQVGVRVGFGQDGIVKREEIERCVKEVMHGEKKIQLKENATRWKKLANDAINGGTSHQNIEELVSDICACT